MHDPPRFGETCTQWIPLPHKGLRAILIALDIQYNIFDLADVSKRFSIANHAADTWRCMLRHCIELKRSGRTIAHEGLSSVIDALVDDHDDAGPQIQAQQPDVELNQDGFPVIDDPPPEADVVNKVIDAVAPERVPEPDNSAPELVPESETENVDDDDDEPIITSMCCGCPACLDAVAKHQDLD